MPEVVVVHNPMPFPLFSKSEGRKKMARKRKRRKHSNRGRRGGSRRKMYNRRKRGGHRRKKYNSCRRKGGRKGRMNSHAAKTKRMWKKHNAKYKAILHRLGKKRGFKRISQLIKAGR